jgi:hypothetical protein
MAASSRASNWAIGESVNCLRTGFRGHADMSQLGNRGANEPSQAEKCWRVRYCLGKMVSGTDVVSGGKYQSAQN